MNKRKIRKNNGEVFVGAAFAVAQMIVSIIVISSVIMDVGIKDSTNDTVSMANYAKFCQEFGDYSDQVARDSLDIKATTGMKGQIINNAQNFCMVARGYDDIGSYYDTDEGRRYDEKGIAGYTMPTGYVLTNSNSKDSEYKYVLQNILRIGLEKGDSYGTKNIEAGKSSSNPKEQVAYVINDGAITGYEKYGNYNSDGSASYKFYGDSNGKEYHLITSDGQVFTLPGFPVEQPDGTIEYHIDSKSGHYYVVKGSASDLKIGDLNVNGDVITNNEAIQVKDLSDVYGKLSDGTFVVGTEYLY